MGDINFEANPTFVLRESDTGSGVKQGVDLANPITFPIRREAMDANFDANPALILKPTGRGSVIRDGKEITRPITFPNGKTPSEDALEDEL
jgi:hypothetical protein